ncbi:GNAT family N-acetyltransferase [Methylobacterium sp. C25]|uniref:GNAT family N-acetyltransferase n=1 Tax=Methylobacterium sp. C25 TaxID=2721622 RepID=UPI001F1840A8|nr:GNAT family N-acetyltransferase [Methylobacterium sp. C25]MCE4222481.1 GNAT family N-acetyltransferase [Methylobacterium sp. C25]
MPSTGRTAEGLVVAALPLDAGSPLLPAWRDLARDPLVENLFFEPEFALAAAHAFGGGIRLLTVSDRPPEAPGARLLALWPCRVVRRWGVPIPALMGWTHGFSIFGAPLLAKSEAAPALRALLDAPRHLGLPRRLLMPYLPLDGPFAALLDDVLARSGRRRADFWAHERGFLAPAVGRDGTRDAYLDAHLSERKARQLARLFRRISADASVEHEIVREPGRLAEALDDYIALESAGWKGQAGTAVAKRPNEAAFLAGLVRSYGTDRRIRFDRLRRDGRSLAVSLSLETASTFWFLKIAHDETEAKNSPGALLVERVTRSLLADPRIAAADSCAPPNFPLIETFWSERRRLAHGLIEAGGGDRLFRPAVALEGLRAQAARVRTSKA